MARSAVPRGRRQALGALVPRAVLSRLSQFSVGGRVRGGASVVAVGLMV